MAAQVRILPNHCNAQRSTGPRIPKAGPLFQSTPAHQATKRTAKQLAHPGRLRSHDTIVMQNKANFLMSKMNASFFLTKGYGNENAFRLKENKPNQTQSPLWQERTQLSLPQKVMEMKTRAG